MAKSMTGALALLAFPGLLSAQTADDVKSDVLSALSTPLPITIVGPLLTRDVTVTEEGEGFRATLEDTTLMGLFPFGEVSMKLVPMGEDSYHVSDLQFPKNLNFPGIASLAFTGMALDGTWNADTRSYEALNAELTGLRLLPGDGTQGMLALGRLAFDVEKEPDETDTESRFDITLGDVFITGLDGSDVTVGEVQAKLSANGDKPVDLYSLLREVMMSASMQDGGVGMQMLGESLLGNTYGSVALDLSAQDLNIIDLDDPEDSFLRAEGLQARLGMQDVNPTHWGGAELAVHLDGVAQQNLMEDGGFTVDRAVVRLSGADLPVADMFAAITTLETAYFDQPVSVSALLDGITEFGALEFHSEGEGLTLEIWDGTYDENSEWVDGVLFNAGYSDWSATLGVGGLNTNEGVITSLVSVDGGSFSPGPIFDEEDLRHVDAWFPQTLRYGGQVANLNEGFLKQLFEDVFIQDIDEPIEIILPLLLWASSSVIDITVEDNRYATALFDISQNGSYRFYPGKFMSLMPIEGTLEMKMTGVEALLDYIEVSRAIETDKDYGDAEEFSILKSVITVLRNLGDRGDDGSVTWLIEKPDVDRDALMVNGTTFYYPDISQFLPLAAFGAAF
jgi:hypothetical protein